VKQGWHNTVQWVDNNNWEGNGKRGHYTNILIKEQVLIKELIKEQVLIKDWEILRDFHIVHFNIYLLICKNYLKEYSTQFSVEVCLP